MRIQTIIAGITVGMLYVTGCSRIASTTKSPSNDTNIQPANLQDARFFGTGDPNTRKDVVAEGSYFKTSGESSTSDFQSRLPNHPVTNQARWRDAEKIISRSGIEYRATIVHSAADQSVEVRVKGQDGNWSNLREVRK